MTRALAIVTSVAAVWAAAPVRAAKPVGQIRADGIRTGPGVFARFKARAMKGMKLVSESQTTLNGHPATGGMYTLNGKSPIMTGMNKIVVRRGKASHPRFLDARVEGKTWIVTTDLDPRAVRQILRLDDNGILGYSQPALLRLRAEKDRRSAASPRPTFRSAASAGLLEQLVGAPGRRPIDPSGRIFSAPQTDDGQDRESARRRSSRRRAVH